MYNSLFIYEFIFDCCSQTKTRRDDTRAHAHDGKSRSVYNSSSSSRHLRRNIGDHFSAVFQWWPAGLAMMIGSFVAGSTPLGGGVIAFPVSVLFLRFTSGESRDISLLIQSVGMNAASYLLVRYKRNLLHEKLIFVFVAVGSVGFRCSCKTNRSQPATTVTQHNTIQQKHNKKRPAAEAVDCK